ncbi:NXPE family member 3-like [Hyla sarda]|uniref:NXPE family member 3-like n=1 Tax=Hyla sarda TaxID=327740 RepID=UPI0024C29470|nr:NXPE family member 3-like [Hyla sarda]XP_056425947.1 NXPE family member 3-like [Hyla sarda]XP_056425949.1 NXPE family member 3-like [Hyla sarda]
MRSLRSCFAALCTVSLLIGFIFRFTLKELSIKVGGKLAAPTTTTWPKTTQLDEELDNLLKMTEWPLPPANTSLEFSTHPEKSIFFLLLPRSTYVVGEKLEVHVMAKDLKGRAKKYGGDYFHAKLHSPRLKAGVSGSVIDHRNGSYTASFILQWPGQTMVSIKLMHSSEAIAILHEKRITRPDKVFFKGYFMQNATVEVVECNFNLPGQDVCEYYDSRNEEKWVCQRPKTLPCDAYRDHSSGGNRKILSKEEYEFFSMSLIEQDLSSEVKSFNVLPHKDKVAEKGPCVSGLQNPIPSGFYYKDTWTSLVCSNQEFNISTKVAECLAGKMVYMFGDSTLRQWWEYLVKFVLTLKQIDLHVTHNPGPLLATDSEYNYIVQWRAHQKPLRMERTGIQELRYIASELDRLGARKGMVIVLTCWSHFLTYPIVIYVQRLRHIREAVIQLLERSPDTKILIKSANTGYKFDHGSDWLSYQLDTVMRAMFSMLPVSILDVWQMTSCHRFPENLHPQEIIIKNEVDLMLSFICPQ